MSKKHDKNLIELSSLLKKFNSKNMQPHEEIKFKKDIDTYIKQQCDFLKSKDVALSQSEALDILIGRMKRNASNTMTVEDVFSYFSIVIMILIFQLSIYHDITFNIVLALLLSTAFIYVLIKFINFNMVKKIAFYNYLCSIIQGKFNE